MATLRFRDDHTASIIGAGGHGRDVLGILEAAGWDFGGFYDDDPDLGFPYVAAAPARSLVAVNDPKIRERLACQRNASTAPLLHPSVQWSESCRVGPASVLAANVVLTVNVRIGGHTHINVGATVSQGATVGDFCTIGPGAHLCGEVEVGDAVFVGAGAVISNLVSVGDDAIIGAGAVVLEDVPPKETWVGVPARPIR